MRSNDLLVRCMARREDDHWVGLCIDFDLAVQGCTLGEVRSKLEQQIRLYVDEAMTVDRKHAAYLLRRKAPLRYRLEFRAIELMMRVRRLRAALAFEMPLPLSTAAA